MPMTISGLVIAANTSGSNGHKEAIIAAMPCDAENHGRDLILPRLLEPMRRVGHVPRWGPEVVRVVLNSMSSSCLECFVKWGSGEHARCTERQQQQLAFRETPSPRLRGGERHST